MDTQSSQKSSIQQAVVQKQESQMEDTRSANIKNEKIQKITSIDVPSIQSPDHIGSFEVEVEMKLFIGSETYKRRQKIRSYEELQQLAQNIIKTNHAHIEGRIIIKYIDVDKDNVNIYDQQSLQQAVDETTNSNQSSLKVFAEFVQHSDPKMPNLTQSFSHHRHSTCSNCSSQNIYSHPNDSYTNIDQINPNVSRAISQNINFAPLSASQFVQNESNYEDDSSSKDEKHGSFKGQLFPPQFFSPTNNSQNVINFANFQQTPTRKNVNGANNDGQKNQQSMNVLNSEQFSHELGLQLLQNSMSQDHSSANPQFFHSQFLQNPQGNQQNKFKYSQQQQAFPFMQYQHQGIPPMGLPSHHPSMMINPYDPQYQQFLMFKEYFQNMVAQQNSYYAFGQQGQQSDFDQDSKKNTSFVNSNLQAYYGRQSSNHSLQNQTTLSEPEFMNNQHRYSNSLNNYQVNLNDTTLSNETQPNKQTSKRDQRVYTSLDEGLIQSQQIKDQIRINHQQNKSHHTNNHHTPVQIKKSKEGAETKNNSQINQNNQNNDKQNNQMDSKNKNQQSVKITINSNDLFDSKQQVLNDSSKNQLSNSEQEQINIDDLSSFKSQKIDDSNSLNKLTNQKLNKEGHQNIHNSSDSDQTVKNISGLSNYYYNGFPNEIQQNSVQPMNYGEIYQNISQVDCFSLTTSKDDKIIPQVIANNLYVFDSPQKKMPLHSPNKSQVIENQSKITLVNDKAISQSVQQNIFKSDQLQNISEHFLRENNFCFGELVEQSIVIQKGPQEQQDSQIPQYIQTLKQIQKKTLDELKKDPNAPQCVQELLSNEKCKFCKKNLICKYKDKQKLIMTIVNHKIKEILPYLRPLIEKQIGHKQQNHIRAFSTYIQVNEEEEQYKKIIQSDKQHQNHSMISEQEEKVSSSAPIQQLDISFNQQNNSYSPHAKPILFKDLSSQQGSDSKQSNCNSNQLSDQKKNDLNNYTFQILNDQQQFGDINHRYSFGSNHRSPRHSVSFDNHSNDQVFDSNQNPLNGQRLHSFNEFPDDSMQISNQFGSPADLQGSFPPEIKKQQLYANIQNIGYPFQNGSPRNNKLDSKQSRFYMETQQQQQQSDFFNPGQPNRKQSSDQMNSSTNNSNNLFGHPPLGKKQSSNTAEFMAKVNGEYYIYDECYDDEEESKEQKPDQKQYKPGSFSNLTKSNKELKKHEQSQQYQVEIAEFNLNQTVDCYPGEKRDILIEVKNTGKKSWDQNNFYLKCIKGVYENQKFPPSQKILIQNDGQVHLQLKIPQEIKTYTTHWRMVETKTNKQYQENQFGPTVKLQFVVKEPPVSNQQFWSKVKEQLYAMVDHNEKDIDKKIHNFIKDQQIKYNYQDINTAKQAELINKIILSYFD